MLRIQDWCPVRFCADCPGFPVLHRFPKFALTHVHSIKCHPTVSSCGVPFSTCLQSFPASGSFSMSQFFTSGGQSIRPSASASVLPMNIQGWFSLGLTGLISLLSKGLSRVFSSTTIWKASVLWHSAFFTPFYFSLFISALLSFHLEWFPFLTKNIPTLPSLLQFFWWNILQVFSSENAFISLTGMWFYLFIYCFFLFFFFVFV